MREITGLAAFVLMLGFCAGLAALSWSNPDMTSRRLWLDHTREMAFLTVGLVVSGIIVITCFGKKK